VGGAATIRAVIFDLWETLIDWDGDANALMHAQVRERVGFDFHERWNRAAERYTTPVREVLTGVGIPDDALDDVMSYRAEFVRTCLVPRAGAVETLGELRTRGLKVGLITVCTEDVELLWPESEFAGLFDAEIFSNAIGLSKPDPRIYLACCEQLGVEPHEAVFVGDGANDELGGARRVGLVPVLIHKAGVDPVWREVRTWDGLRVTSIPEVLEVLERC
jgi:HAD superfamily hydrolase (TIGR01509 family)